MILDMLGYSGVESLCLLSRVAGDVNSRARVLRSTASFLDRFVKLEDSLSGV